MIESRQIQVCPLKRSRLTSFGIYDLKAPSKKGAAITEKQVAPRTSRKVSPSNCSIRLILLLPHILRMAISFARRKDWAVDRLIKLIPARISINTAIPIKAYKVGKCALPE